MALNVVDQPYQWTLRGQKLLFRVSSNNIAQDGFRYGVEVTDIATTKTFTFFLNRSPSTDDLLFDLSPVVKMFNDESSNTMHKVPAQSPWVEPMGGSWKEYTITFSEWWIVNGVLTKYEESDISETQYLLNGYYQPSDGYKPDVDSVGATQLAMTGTTSRYWTDRQSNTHIWYNVPISGFIDYGETQMVIPCFNTDYGILNVPRGTTLEGNAERVLIQMYTSTSLIGTHSFDLSSGNTIYGVGLYPMNLNDDIYLPSYVRPIDTPNWAFYIVLFYNSDMTSIVSKSVVFYNAERYGQFDCKYDYVRLAWVNSRSGWDYFNFIKKNEISNDFSRKQYRKLLVNNQGTFNSWQRQLTDRETIVTQTLTITSDWIQENEFVFLRSLFASNQVELIGTSGDNHGKRTPVSLIDTTFLERKERNGKLYNITIKLNYSQDYWT